jgi:ribose transport system substrate-binding protein
LRGFKDALKDFPNIKVTMSKNANYARPVALDLFKTMLKLSNPPQVDGVLAANDAMALGVLEAYKDAKKKPPLIVGINGSKEIVELIKSGEILASGDYNGLVEGCLGAEIAILALRKQEAPKEIMAKTSVVDKSNVAAYETPVERRPCPTLASFTAK